MRYYKNPGAKQIFLGDLYKNTECDNICLYHFQRSLEEKLLNLYPWINCYSLFMLSRGNLVLNALYARGPCVGESCLGNLVLGTLPRESCPGNLVWGTLPRESCPGNLAQGILPRESCPGDLAQGILPRESCPGNLAQGISSRRIMPQNRQKDAQS